MTFFYALATLWPKISRNMSRIFLTKTIFLPATRGHKLVYVRQAFLIPLFCFIVFSNARAQPVGERFDAGLTHIKPLQIGETIPEKLWDLPLLVVNHSDGKDTINLNDYRSKKLIIIDFWATWCTTCLAAMPRLDSLQHAVDNLTIIPVTQESLDRLAPFLERNPVAQKVNLKTVYGDNILKQYFPFRLIPHYIWIYNGRFLTATSAAEINLKTMRILFSTGNSDVVPKIDILGFDKNQSLMDNINRGKLVVPTIYSITFSDKIQGLGSSQSHTKKYGMVRRYFLNRPISDLYRFALSLETSEDQIFFDLGENNIDPKNLICYEQIYDEKISIDPNKQMLEDLNQRFKLYISEVKTSQENTGATSKIVVIKPTK